MRLNGAKEKLDQCTSKEIAAPTSQTCTQRLPAGNGDKKNAKHGKRNLNEGTVYRSAVR